MSIGPLALVTNHLLSPLAGLNNIRPDHNFIFHGPLTGLSSEGQRQFGRLIVMMSQLVEEHFNKLENPSPLAKRGGHDDDFAILLQQLTASCGSALLLNPWGHHIIARHPNHWVGSRIHQFRVGKSRGTIGVQTTLQHDKDYRAMKVTLVSYLATAEEPIARQALLNEERNEHMSLALAHRMIQKLCEVPAFRISIVTTHRRLIKGALAEEAAEAVALKRAGVRTGGRGGSRAPSVVTPRSRNRSTAYSASSNNGGADVTSPDDHRTDEAMRLSVRSLGSGQNARSDSVASGVRQRSPTVTIGNPSGWWANVEQMAGFDAPSPSTMLTSPLAELGLSVDVPDIPTLASILLQTSATDHFSRPMVEVKSDMTPHLVLAEAAAREDMFILCRTTYERIALQRHIDLQRILASVDRLEMDFQHARESLELRRLKRKKREQESMLAIFNENDD